MSESVWWVYIIETYTGSLYTGISKDVERRWQEHLDVANGVANAKGAKFFRINSPKAIVFKQAFHSRSDASKQEIAIKKMNAKDKKELILTSIDGS